MSPTILHKCPVPHSHARCSRVEEINGEYHAETGLDIRDHRAVEPTIWPRSLVIANGARQARGILANAAIGGSYMIRVLSHQSLSLSTSYCLTYAQARLSENENTTILSRHPIQAQRVWSWKIHMLV